MGRFEVYSRVFGFTRGFGLFTREVRLFTREFGSFTREFAAFTRESTPFARNIMLSLVSYAILTHKKPMLFNMSCFVMCKSPNCAVYAFVLNPLSAGGCSVPRVCKSSSREAFTRPGN